MKREDAIKTINWIINNDKSEGIESHGLRVMSYLEDIGMLPPLCAVTIKDDKHTPTERKWDEGNG